MSEVQVSHRIPDELKRYIDLAAATLRVSKSQVVIAALSAHRDYLVRTGVLPITESE